MPLGLIFQSLADNIHATLFTINRKAVELRHKWVDAELALQVNVSMLLLCLDLAMVLP